MTINNNIIKNDKSFISKKPGTLLMISVMVCLVMASLASAAESSPTPKGVQGIVYLSDGITQAPKGTNFSVEDITNGYRIEGTTGRPTGGSSGFYSVSIRGIDDDKLIIRAWNKTLGVSGTVKTTLSGEMDGIDVIMNNSIFQCSDVKDNDGDGQIDLNDPGCDYAEDNNEKPQCNDGIDNDGDGKIDLDDAGCENIQDNDESNLPQCSDGIDNNGDGKIDILDPNCENAKDDSEYKSTDIDCNGIFNWNDVTYFARHYYGEIVFPNNKRLYPCLT